MLRSHRWRTAENSAAYLLPHLRDDMTLLDVGCGPATITADLADARRGRSSGIDPSRVGDRRARRRRSPTLDARASATSSTSTGTTTSCTPTRCCSTSRTRSARCGRWATLGDLVAARDSDYTWFQWSPDSPALDRWLEVLPRGDPPQRRRRRRRPPPAARGRTRPASPTSTYTTSTWTFATPRTGPGGAALWADRCGRLRRSPQQAVDYGIATDGRAAPTRRRLARRGPQRPRRRLRRRPRRDPRPRPDPAVLGRVTASACGHVDENVRRRRRGGG